MILQKPQTLDLNELFFNSDYAKPATWGLKQLLLKNPKKIMKTLVYQFVDLNNRKLDRKLSEVLSEIQFSLNFNLWEDRLLLLLSLYAQKPKTMNSPWLNFRF